MIAAVATVDQAIVASQIQDIPQTSMDRNYRTSARNNTTTTPSALQQLQKQPVLQNQGHSSAMNQFAAAHARPSMVAVPTNSRPFADPSGPFGTAGAASAAPFPGAASASSAPAGQAKDAGAGDAASTPDADSSEGANGEKRYACSECGHLFTRRHNLKSHLLIHSQLKPHICTICNSKFRRSHDLKRHKKLHTGEKPFKCATCGRTFARSDALVRHNNSQSGCDLSFRATQATPGVSAPSSQPPQPPPPLPLPLPPSASGSSASASSVSSLNSLSSTGASTGSSISNVTGPLSPGTTPDPSALGGKRRSSGGSNATAGPSNEATHSQHDAQSQSRQQHQSQQQHRNQQQHHDAFKRPSYETTLWKVALRNNKPGAALAPQNVAPAASSPLSLDGYSNSPTVHAAAHAPSHTNDNTNSNRSIIQSYSPLILSEPSKLITSSHRNKPRNILSIPHINNNLLRHQYQQLPAPKSTFLPPASLITKRTINHTSQPANVLNTNMNPAESAVPNADPHAVAPNADQSESLPSSAPSSATSSSLSIISKVPGEEPSSSKTSNLGLAKESTRNVTFTNPSPASPADSVVQITRDDFNSMVQYIKTLESKIDTLETSFARSEKNFESLKSQLLQEKSLNSVAGTASATSLGNSLSLESAQSSSNGASSGASSSTLSGSNPAQKVSSAAGSSMSALR